MALELIYEKNCEPVLLIYNFKLSSLLLDMYMFIIIST